MNFEQPPDNKNESSVEQELSPEEEFEACEAFMEEERVQLEEHKKELAELDSDSPRAEELREIIKYLEEQMELWEEEDEMEE